LEELIEVNDNAEKKYKESVKQVKELEKDKENFEIQSKNYKTNFENEMKEKNKNKILIDKFKQLLNQLLIYNKDNELIKSQNQNFIDKIKYYFEPEREDTNENAEEGENEGRNNYNYNEEVDLNENNYSRSNINNRQLHLMKSKVISK